MDKREITGRVVKRGEAEKEFDREFWHTAGPEARLAAGWQMVVDHARLHGISEEELRLQKSVENVIRRRR